MKVDIKKGMRTIENDFKVSTKLIRMLIKKEKKLPVASSVEEKKIQLEYIRQKQSELSKALNYESFCSLLRFNLVILAGIELSGLMLDAQTISKMATVHISTIGVLGLAGTKKAGDYSIKEVKLDHEINVLERNISEKSL